MGPKSKIAPTKEEVFSHAVALRMMLMNSITVRPGVTYKTVCERVLNHEATRHSWVGSVSFRPSRLKCLLLRV
jgi:hypothetical protein